MQETVSELIGKSLLTKSGEYLGCVAGVQTDAQYRRIRNVACFDREEEDFLLPASAIAQIGQDALVVQYASRRACKNCVPLPLKCRTYSQNGDELGAIDDFLRSGTELTGVVLSNGQAYPLERLVKVADVAVLDLSEPFVPPKTRKAPVQRSARPAKAPAGNARTAPAAECAAEGGAAAQGTNAPAERDESEAASAAIAEAANTAERDGAPQTDSPADPDIATLREAAVAVAEESAERKEGAAAAGAAEGSPAAGADSEGAQTDGSGARTAQAAPPPKDAGARAAVRAGKGLLTGKILPADLTDVRGNVLALAGTRVTADVIRRAMAHNKLFALTMLCSRQKV